MKINYDPNLRKVRDRNKKNKSKNEKTLSIAGTNYDSNHINQVIEYFYHL